ncbi:MAG: hypothetical protein PHW54_00770 [Candidatus Omnitrophica bacterium]|nr:hypothetical protein [Candidatus Omnitrophota bacterium]
MSKRVSFYFSVTAILAIVIALVLMASNSRSKKPDKPAESAVLPAAEAPAPQTPPAIEQKTPEAVVPAVVTQVPPEAEEAKVLKYEFQKGMTYVAWTGSGYSNENSVKAMEQMASLGVNWVAVLATWYQDKHNSPKVYPQMDKTPSDQSLIFAIRKLHELKFKIMLKPHLDIVEGNGKWRGEIGFDSDTDWQAWFDSYTAFILRYADIAAKENVEIICIGTELTNAALTQPERWRELIKKVREVYKGQLTYAANWDKEFKEIAFWDALDYAGIDPYFPLVTSTRPQVEELKSAWQDWLKSIEEWQKKINKPVVFTEIGYKSSRDAADEPWQHAPMGELDLVLQVNLYQALLETFWEKPWFYGAYWWYWGTNPRMGGENNRGFTPQNKPAQDVIKEWYTKPLSQQREY